MTLTEEQKELFDALTLLQQKFATGIIEGLNQTDAYIKAGGRSKGSTARSKANQIGSNRNVKAFLDSMKEAALNDAVMTRQEALERLSKMARTSISDLLEFGSYEITKDDGEQVKQATWCFKDSADIDKDKLSAISEVTAGKEGLKIKLHDPKAAIKQLADLMGWEAPKKTELTGRDGGPIETATLTKEEYKQARLEMLKDDDC